MKKFCPKKGVHYTAIKNKSSNEFQFIIIYLFLQSLEKASILGLPLEYQKKSQNSNKVRGKININAYIKNNIPFTGKITTDFQEQNYVQPIIDILYVALNKIELLYGNEITSNLKSVKQILKQNYAGKYFNAMLLNNAINHRVLLNPQYSSFKKVLEYAEIILNMLELNLEDINSKTKTVGYLFDISQLFEVYIEKLLNRHFLEWNVSSQLEINTYENLFFKRKMYPDIVLIHKITNKKIVFDAKFKTMRLIKDDLDRTDYFQIHTYIHYFEPDVILGGLIYPLMKNIDNEKYFSDIIYGKDFNNTKFILDGIYVNNELSIEELVKNEIEFLKRLENEIETVLNTI